MVMKRKNGFTLIELLVVVSIIALLVSILMPALGKAREQAKRVVCGTQLKQLSTAAFNFAADHDGLMPQAFRHGNDAPLYMPIYFNDASSETIRDADPTATDDYADDNWKRFGVPYEVWKEYGAVEEILICPSQKWLAKWGNHVNHNVPHDQLYFIPSTFRGDSYTFWGGDQWHRWLRHTYMYVAGISVANTGNYGWERKEGWAIKPYVRGMRQPATRVVAADAVYSIPEGTAWQNQIPDGTEYFINHVSSTQADMPAYQNLVYGDSHVETKGPGYYEYGLSQDPLDEDGQWSYRTWSIATGPFWYWEGTRHDPY